MSVSSCIKASYLILKSLAKPSFVSRYYEPIERFETDVGIYQRLQYIFSNPLEIYPNLFLGNSLNAANKEQLNNLNINIIINVTDNIPNFFENDFQYFNITIKDNSFASFGNELDKCASFINENLELNKKIMVHCFEGRSRSVAVIIHYLMNYQNLTFYSAYEQIKQKKQIVNLNKSFVNELTKNTRERSKSLDLPITNKKKLRKVKSFNDLLGENYVFVKKISQ
jgi:protein-tyrosine phosphatase